MRFGDKKTEASLRGYKTYLQRAISLGSSLLSGIFSRRRGSLTVETAVVLPLFMFAMVSLMSFCEVIRGSDIVAAVLHQNARKMAVYAYAADKTGIVSHLPSALSGIAMSYTYVDGQVQDKLGDAGVKDRSVSYLGSKVMEDDIIDFVAVREVRLPFDLWGIGTFSVADRARVHAFTGYDPAGRNVEEGEDDEELVYITPTGSVYHSSRNCPHLKVTPRLVQAGALEGARNSQGGKYYPCEYCRKVQGVSTYYVTDYGDRYHTTLNCQGMKRDVRLVPVSEAEGRSPCKTCGR